MNKYNIGDTIYAVVDPTDIKSSYSIKEITVSQINKIGNQLYYGGTEYLKSIIESNCFSTKEEAKQKIKDIYLNKLNELEEN